MQLQQWVLGCCTVQAAIKCPENLSFMEPAVIPVTFEVSAPHLSMAQDSSATMMAPAKKDDEYEEEEDFEEGLYFETADPLRVTDHEGSEDEDNIFDCGICQDKLTMPKSLPCLHNFCYKCLDRYAKTLSVQDLHTGDTVVRCPLCRAVTTMPKGGTEGFPTNFHVSRLQAQKQSLDLGFTLREALEYLEDREEEIVDILQERKRRTLVDVSTQREVLVGKVDAYMESLHERVRDQFYIDSHKAIDSLRKVKLRLEQLKASAGPGGDASGSMPNLDIAESSGSLIRLRRHAEVVANVANELEELRLSANKEQDKILNYRLVFVPAEGFSESEIKSKFGYLCGKTGDDRKGEGKSDDGGGTGYLTSTMTSWGQLLIALLPAALFVLIMKLYDAVNDEED